MDSRCRRWPSSAMLGPAEYLLEMDGTVTLIREPLDPTTLFAGQHYR